MYELYLCNKNKKKVVLLTELSIYYYVMSEQISFENTLSGLLDMFTA